MPINKNIDIWSLGVLLVELFTGNTPYEGNSQGQIVEDIYSKNVKVQGIPNEIMRIIQSMLEINPNKRPTLAQIQQSNIMDRAMSASQLRKKLC